MKSGHIGNFALVISSIFFSLVVIEVCARVLGWSQIIVFAPNEKWGYLMKPSQTVFSYGHPININSLGLRGHEINKHKVRGIIRVLFIGDSITYGGGRIKEEQLFCRIVESSLNKNNLNAEIINLSAPAWGPQNWIKYIESHGLYEADIVILVLPECDLGRQFTDWQNAHFKENAPRLRLHTSFLKVYSVIYENFSSTKTESTKLELNNLELNTNINSNLDGILKLIQTCRAKNILFLAVFIPSVPNSDFAMHWPKFESIIPDAIDLRNKLNHAAYFMDGIHLNVKGHALVGEAIFEKLNELL